MRHQDKLDLQMQKLYREVISFCHTIPFLQVMPQVTISYSSLLRERILTFYQ